MIRFILWLLYRRWRDLQNAWESYRIHGIKLPRGSLIELPKAVKIGSGFSLGRDCRLYCHKPEAGSRLVIGDRVALNDGVVINADSGGQITLGNDVIIGPNSILRGANHVFEDTARPIREQNHAPGTITLEQDVWLGAGVIVLPNVTIGRGTVVGAGSVVTRDLPPFSVAVGIPARVTKERGGQAGAQSRPVGSDRGDGT